MELKNEYVDERTGITYTLKRRLLFPKSNNTKRHKFHYWKIWKGTFEIY